MKNTDNKVSLTINRFGPFLNEEDSKRILKNETLNITTRALESFFNIPRSYFNKDNLGRYREITNKETYIIFAPEYKNITERIINPLIAAKRHYCLSEYVSCIAVSGIICEMLALLVWKISSISIEGKILSKEEEENLFGDNFEGISQRRKIEILKTIKAIDQSASKTFHEVRNIRNKYMHSWEYETIQQKGDAKKIISNTFKLFKRITNMELKVDETGNQTISINPKLLKFLQTSNK